MGNDCLKRDFLESERKKRRAVVVNPTVLRETTIGDVVIRVVHGDLARETSDLLINEANTHLVHSGGVA
jgi:hypothetical protein